MSYLKGKIMKADRLISILMLLQIHNQLTAKELSKQLEVSIRTIYRDVESLSSLGIPVYADRGINGGIKLLGDYKTSLNGINNDEIFSLFLSTGDKILEDLGMEKLKNSTILKLLGNSSPNQLKEIENIQNFIYIDMNTWGEVPTTLNKDILSQCQNSIWNSKVLKFVYEKTNETKDVILSPLGLVCKRGVWYLVGINNDITKTYKVNSIKSIYLIKNLIPKYTFTFKVDKSILNSIRERKFITIRNTTIKENKIYLDIDFDAKWQGIEFAFGYGKYIQIIEPKDAISEIKEKASEIINLYN